MKQTLLNFCVILSLTSAAAYADIEEYDFSFAVTGDRAVRPMQVITDGTKTYFQFRQNQPVPAIFAGGRIVRFTVEQPYIVTHGLDKAYTLVGQSGKEKAEVAYTGDFKLTKFDAAAPAPVALPQEPVAQKASVQPTQVKATESEKPVSIPVKAAVAQQQVQSSAEPTAKPVAATNTQQKSPAQTLPAVPVNPVSVSEPKQIQLPISVNANSDAKPVVAAKPEMPKKEAYAGEFTFFPGANSSKPLEPTVPTQALPANEAGKDKAVVTESMPRQISLPVVSRKPQAISTLQKEVTN